MQRKTKKRVQHNFAVVCARGLGDALLSMVLAHNLRLSGKQVTIFSSILCELKDWFPGFQILPYPAPKQFSAIFSSFDSIIAADHSIIKENHQFGNQLIILKENDFDKKHTMVDNLQSICKKQFSLPFARRENGIVPLKQLMWRQHINRILLHPMSSEIKKNWPAKKFIALANLLEREGFQPYFCVSPAEAPMWQSFISEERLPSFPTVSSLASFIYESGYLIGNDSGVGHLAASLNIPTLSLFARKSYANLWRPGWGLNVVVTPPNILFGSRMKQKYWKSLLKARRVKNMFYKLREETLAHPSLFAPKF